MKNESRTQAFLEMNPNGRVPTLQIEPHVYLPESNAILHYLGEGTALDIALFAYTNPASDGGFDLSRYKAINAWLARVKAQPGYVEMPSPG